MTNVSLFLKVAIKRFVDDIAVIVIEQELLCAVKDLLSPLIVFDMSPQQIELIAGESEQCRMKRQALEGKLGVCCCDDALTRANVSQALVVLSNALMVDGRVFHITKGDFIERINQQSKVLNFVITSSVSDCPPLVQLEMGQTKGWFLTSPNKRVPASQVIEEADARLADSGWRNVERALASTVR